LDHVIALAVAAFSVQYRTCPDGDSLLWLLRKSSRKYNLQQKSEIYGSLQVQILDQILYPDTVRSDI